MNNRTKTPDGRKEIISRENEIELRGHSVLPAAKSCRSFMIYEADGAWKESGQHAVPRSINKEQLECGIVLANVFMQSISINITLAL